MRKPKGNSIGIFDSGFGGLDILREIIREIPGYSYIYLGDTARTPYGNRSQEVIYNFTRQAVDFLFKEGCQLIILACNTASSEALRRIQREFLPQKYHSKKVLGVIIPAAEAAAKATKNNRVGIIGTEGTVTSGAFKRELKKLNPKIKVFQKACPLLVPIVEAGEQDSQAADLIIKDYLYSVMQKNIDTLILGCTHYGLLEKQVQKVLGKGITLITEKKVIVQKLRDYLKRHPEIEQRLGKQKKIKFLTTDLTDKFKILGGKFFGKKIVANEAELT